MKSPTSRVISIGALAAHPLWNERGDVRTGHTTTTLIVAGGTRLIVDPGLPTQALAARLSERSDVRHDAVTHVFVTSFRFDHYRGLPLFPEATWLMSELELEQGARMLQDQQERAEEIGDDELLRQVEQHRTLLGRFRPADDHVTPGIDLFPLPGVTLGTCGLLLPLPARTVLVCGDAVATVEHLEQGKVLPVCADIEQAQDSFREAIEIADTLILGRDNIVSNPLRR